MRIDTHIPGDPAGIRAVAGWLRSSLSAGVSDATTRIYQARGAAEGGWTGPAASAFTARMSTVGAGGDLLAADVARLGGSLEEFADAVHTAKAGMHRAREIARDAGLTVGADYIHLPPGGEDPLKKAAWRFAEEEARRARRIVHAAEDAGREIWRDIERKKYLRAAEFVNGAAEKILDRQASALETQARILARLDKPTAAEAARATGGLARRVGGKLPYVGLGIAAVDVAMDIHDGTPPAKAVYQSAVGFAVGTVVGDAVGAGLTSVAGPWVGVPAGIVAGAAAGELASVGAGKLYDLEVKVADAAYDNLVPDPVKHAIPKPVKKFVGGLLH
jgi:hypothetical protein